MLMAIRFEFVVSLTVLSADISVAVIVALAVASDDVLTTVVRIAFISLVNRP